MLYLYIFIYLLSLYLYHSQGTLLAHVLLAEPKPLVLFSSNATLVVNLAMDQNVAASCHINNAYLLI